MLLKPIKPLIQRRIRSLFLSGILIALLLSGCRELVQDEFPDFTPVPTVNSFLVADSLIRVHVSLCGKLDSVPLTVVDDATVTCFIDDSLSEILKNKGDGYYSGKTIARAGNVYHFTVSVPGYTDMSAIDTVPERVELLRFEHINVAGVDEEGHTYPAIRITFPVDPNHVKYYQVEIKYNTSYNWQSGQYKDFSDPYLLAEGLPIAVFSTERIQDTIYTMHLDYTTGHYGRTDNGPWITHLYPLLVEFKTISYQYYQYLRQLYLYNTGRYPDFQFGPYKAFPLYSNVNNGMGIVAGYSRYISEIITPEY